MDPVIREPKKRFSVFVFLKSDSTSIVIGVYHDESVAYFAVPLESTLCWRDESALPTKNQPNWAFALLALWFVNMHFIEGECMSNDIWPTVGTLYAVIHWGGVSENTK